MQRISERIQQKGRFGIAAFGWAAGLIIAGSDSSFMPWVNAFGIIVFWLSSMVIGKQMLLLERKSVDDVTEVSPWRPDNPSCWTESVSERKPGNVFTFGAPMGCIIKALR